MLPRAVCVYVCVFVHVYVDMCGHARVGAEPQERAARKLHPALSTCTLTETIDHRPMTVSLFNLNVLERFRFFFLLAVFVHVARDAGYPNIPRTYQTSPSLVLSA